MGKADTKVHPINMATNFHNNNKKSASLLGSTSLTIPIFLPSPSGVCLAVRVPTLGIEALAFQVLVTVRTRETVRVIGCPECLHPSVSGLNRELARDAFCSEKLIPIAFTVWLVVLEEE